MREKPKQSKSPEFVTLVCAGCGVTFERKDAYYRAARAKGQTEFFHRAGCRTKSINRKNRAYYARLRVGIE